MFQKILLRSMERFNKKEVEKLIKSKFRRKKRVKGPHLLESSMIT